jgi:hypothetical protein
VLVADQLAITVEALQKMIRGPVRCSTSQCRRAEAAPAKYEVAADGTDIATPP